MTRLEDQARHQAGFLAETERQAAQEYARLRALGQSSWDAQRGVDETYAVALRSAQVEYEIALEALRRERCR